MTAPICRWGFLGAAQIARKNWHSVALSGNGQVVAVASRDQQRAQQFINDCQASVPVDHPVEALGRYEDLLARDDLDAVYIPLPTAVRKEWVIRAASAGRHVLVEKPCAVTTADLEEMIEVCRNHQVQFMDGVMFLHSRRLSAIRQCLDASDGIGSVRHISSQFTFAADPDFYSGNIRGSVGLEPAGCLGDLGWYTIALSLWVMNGELPDEVRGWMPAGIDRTDGRGQVPVEFQGQMSFGSGASAAFFCSFRCANSQTAVISGENGCLTMDDFVLPFYGCQVNFEEHRHDFVVDGCRFNMEQRTCRHSTSEYSNNARNAQEVNLFRNFADQVLSGRVDPHWPEISLRTQRVMNAVLESAEHRSAPVQP